MGGGKIILRMLKRHVGNLLMYVLYKFKFGEREKDKERGEQLERRRSANKRALFFSLLTRNKNIFTPGSRKSMTMSLTLYFLHLTLQNMLSVFF